MMRFIMVLIVTQLLGRTAMSEAQPPSVTDLSICRDAGTTWTVALPAGAPTGAASIREHAFAWHPGRQVYYLVADVVPLDNPHHPNTYDTELHLWRSPNLADWTYIGVAVPKGVPGHSYDGYGVASPSGIVCRDDRIYVPFSARKTAGFAQRGIGLAWSGPDPDVVPWTKTAAPISDLSGEDDDPSVVLMPGDPRLHLYHRTTGGGYHIVHTATSTPEDPASWPPAQPVTMRPEGVRAQELTGVVCADGVLHMFVIEMGKKVHGIQISHLAARDPAALFEPASRQGRYLTDQPARLAYGGHFTPVVRDGRFVAAFWTVPQLGQRYGLQGHPATLAAPPP